MKKISFSAVFLICGALLFSQSGPDTSDTLYRDLQAWFNAGLIEELPPVRPYPLQVIKPALEQVVRKGGPSEKALAEDYLRLFKRDGFAALSHFAEVRSDEEGQSMLRAGTDLHVDFWFSDFVTAQSRTGIYGIRTASAENPQLYPRGERSPLFLTDDNASIGGGIKVRPNLMTSLGIGFDDLYFQTGIMKADYGPHLNNGIFLGGQFPEAPHYSFSWSNGIMNANIVYIVLQAMNSNGNPPEQGKYDHKQILFHSYGARIAPWFDFRLNESMTFGRFDPLYLTPLTVYFYNQILGDLGDNNLTGLNADFHLPYNINASFGLNIDDADFNNLVKLKFNTKFKGAIQAGLSWSPLEPWLRQISMDYTAVMPFSFTHENSAWPGYTKTNLSLPNFLNYTSAGISLGADLKPNSDRWTLGAEWIPVDRWRVSFLGRMIRHGNANEGTAFAGWTKKVYPLNTTTGLADTTQPPLVITIEEGGPLDTGFHAVDSAGNLTDGTGTLYQFQTSNPFLTQSLLETSLLLSLQTRFELPFDPHNQLYAEGGYAVEQIWNQDLVRGKSDINQFFNFGLGYSWRF